MEILQARILEWVALARDGVSREVPCSALKGETVLDSLPATPKSSPTRHVPSRGTPSVPSRTSTGIATKSSLAPHEWLPENLVVCWERLKAGEEGDDRG